MPLIDPNLFYGKGLIAILALITITITFWLWHQSRKPEQKGAY